MGHDGRGASLIEMIWEELDATMDDLMSRPLPSHEDNAEVRGVARGLAISIGILTNPYGAPGDRLDAVRSEALERWEARS